MPYSTSVSDAATGGSTGEQAKEQVRGAAQMATGKASSALGQARARLREQVGQRSSQAGSQVHATAQDVRSVAQHLREQGRQSPADVADQLADRVESFGSYLRGADGERLLRDAETFARRQPWAVAAGGLVLGFAVSRLMKASSSRRSQAWNDGSLGAEAPDLPGGDDGNATAL